MPSENDNAARSRATAVRRVAALGYRKPDAIPGVGTKRRRRALHRGSVVRGRVRSWPIGVVRSRRCLRTTRAFHIWPVSRRREGVLVSINHKAEIDRHFRAMVSMLPARLSRSMHWLRQPSSRLFRIPLSIFLILGGVFGFLPVLGFWMLPLGVILIAQDIPVLAKPTARALGWLERKWIAYQQKRQRNKSET